MATTDVKGYVVVLILIPAGSFVSKVESLRESDPVSSGTPVVPVVVAVASSCRYELDIISGNFVQLGGALVDRDRDCPDSVVALDIDISVSDQILFKECDIVVLQTGLAIRELDCPGSGKDCLILGSNGKENHLATGEAW